MKTAFRVDSSLSLGTGHVIRCLTLADALRLRGVECHFLCKDHDGNLIDLIRQRGYQVRKLPVILPALLPDVQKDVPGEGGTWLLGCSWKVDAEQTLYELKLIQPDLLVTDHYGIDRRWQTIMRPHVRRILVIDDLADRPHECDFLLDQNWFGERSGQRYKHLLPRHCIAMLGPEYALLKPEYGMLRKEMPKRDGNVARILVFMGGSDCGNETAKVLFALCQVELAHLLVDVAIGLNHPDPDGVANLVISRPGTSLHRGLPSLASCMARADLMISAGGSTSWERMCLGLPSIVISVADNQMETNVALSADDYIDFLGASEQVTIEMIADAIKRCLREPHRLSERSQACQTLGSGNGAQNVAEIIMS